MVLCEQHIPQTSFLTFSNFFLSSKYDKSLWRLNKFFGISTSTSRKYSSLLFSLYFFMKRSSSFDNSFKTSCRKFLRHCPSIQIVCIWIHKIFFPFSLLQKFYIVFCSSYVSICKDLQKTIVLSSGHFLQVFAFTIQCISNLWWSENSPSETIP